MLGLDELPKPVGYVLGGGASLGAIQVGMLQALSECRVTPDLVAGTSVGSLNAAVIAADPKGAVNRLSHAWARMTRDQVFPGRFARPILAAAEGEDALVPKHRTRRE